MNDHSSVIEATLRDVPHPLTSALDPIATALRERGHRSVSVGLLTAQVDGRLYDLDLAAQSALTDWESGAHPGPVTIRLVRHTVA